MSRLGVVELFAELAIGHVKEALVATYDLIHSGTPGVMRSTASAATSAD